MRHIICWPIDSTLIRDKAYSLYIKWAQTSPYKLILSY